MKALFLFLLSSSLLVNDAVAWTPVASNDGTTLATALTGVGGFAISNPSYSGGENSAATFSDAPSALGFTQGLVITTGNATLASHPVTENATGSWEGGDDPDLPGSYFDAAALTFEFTTGPGETQVTFQYRFCSDEFITYPNFADGFKLLINGVNIALLPNEELVTNTNLSVHYREYAVVNNPDNPLGVVYDGCSILLTATATGLTPGVVNTAKFVIADYLDFSVDSAVFLAGSSFRPNNPPVVDEGIPNQSASVGFSFSYSIPSDAFSDADEDPLTYLATKEDNSPLPEWLTFDGTTFSGTPTGAGTLSIKVTAGDGSATAYTTFNIVITENTPIPTLTATSTPTPTPTVFNTPLPTVTPTPGGVPSTITGRVLDSNGNPLPGVVVSGGELGIAVTSNDGTYTFTNVSGGEDYTFSFHRDKYIIPSFMHSGNLAEAQDAIALKDATDAKPECGETDLTPILKKSGNYCSKLKELGLNEYVFLVSNYQEHSRVLPHAGHVRNTLLGAFLQNVKHITQLAERERKCPGRPCETTKHSKTISRYLKDIRHLNRSIITLSRLNLTVKPKRKAHNLSVVAKSRLLQRQAIKKINEYPKKTFWCE